MNEPDQGRDWLDEVRRLPADRIFVLHNPPTPRYGRAQAKLGYLLKGSTYLGLRPHESGVDRVEVALWAPNPEGRGHGYYACLRLFMERGVVSAAMLFCFYDGTEKSPGMRSLMSALEFARLNGFKDTP